MIEDSRNSAQSAEDPLAWLTWKLLVVLVLVFLLVFWLMTIIASFGF